MRTILDQYCNKTVNGCNNWTYFRRKSICVALTDCNEGRRQNGFVSGPPGCVSEGTPEIEGDYSFTNPKMSMLINILSFNKMPF